MSLCQGINRRFFGYRFTGKNNKLHRYQRKRKVSTSVRQNICRLCFMNFVLQSLSKRRGKESRLARRRTKGSLILFVYSNQVQQQQIFTPITFQSTIINCSFQLLFFFAHFLSWKESFRQRPNRPIEISGVEVSGLQDKLFSHSRGISQISSRLRQLKTHLLFHDENTNNKAGE